MTGGGFTDWTDRSSGSPGVQEAGIYPLPRPMVDHHCVPPHSAPTDGVQSLHAGVVALQSLADVLGVGVGHAVDVEVAQAGARHQHNL